MSNSNNHKLMLSVVVPVYNVEEYLTECLDSIDRGIRNIEAEVILVDDGSTDTSGEMAQEYADTHPGFRCLHKENGGLSDARNYGAARAVGKYIAFVDSDDIVCETMYENMVKAAEYHKADLTIVNVARCNSKKIWGSVLHQKVFFNLDKTVTHISECDNLIFDTTAWNKLIRRSFWEENAFQYPVGWRFEDMPVSLAMHSKANCVAIVHEVGYLWRVRDRESVSITQENGSIINLVHRIAMLESMFDYIERECEGDKRLVALLKHKIVFLDLILYINQMNSISSELAEEYREEIMRFFDKHFSINELSALSVLTQQKYEYLFSNDMERLKKIIAFGKKHYAKMPWFEKEGHCFVELPSDLFTISDRNVRGDLKWKSPQSFVSDIVSDGIGLTIKGHVYFPRISVHTPEEMSVQAFLMDSLTGAHYKLLVDRFQNDDLTKDKGYLYSRKYDRASEYDYTGTGFVIYIDKDVITAAGSKDRSYYLMISYQNRYFSGCKVLFERETDYLVYSEGLTFGSEDDYLKLSHDIYGQLLLSPASTNNSPLAMPDEKRPLLKKMCSDDSGVVSFEVSLNPLHSDGVYTLDYYDDYSCEYKTLSIGVIEENHLSFSIDFSDQNISRDLYNGKHLLSINSEIKGAQLRHVLFADRYQRLVLKVGTLKIGIICDSDFRLCLHSKGLWADEDINEDRRRYNLAKMYPKYRKEPLEENCILFESYWGTKYQCNPRALYEYIAANHPEYKCVWSFVDERTPIVGNGIRVKKKSLEYYHYLATAKYLVNNVNFEDAYKKRKGQIEIQTMHGTPYKSLGLDVPGDYVTKESKIKYIRRNRRWNYLIVQGQFSKKMAWQWFRYDRAMLETGYPRTDAVYQVTNEERNSIKKRLCLPLDKKVIMYAPTYRRMGIYNMPLDLNRLKAVFGENYILMIRLHHFATAAYEVPVDGEFIFDLGHFGDIEELFKITDVLVTDYSSIMFDFALTGKPMIFHTYDLDEYSKELRGSYFDIVTEAPGAITRTDDELIEAIKAIEVGNPKNQDRIELFVNKYLTYENGNSSEQIFKKVFIEDAKHNHANMRQRIQRLAEKLLPKKYAKKIRRIRMENRI